MSHSWNDLFEVENDDRLIFADMVVQSSLHAGARRFALAGPRIPGAIERAVVRDVLPQVFLEIFSNAEQGRFYHALNRWYHDSSHVLGMLAGRWENAYSEVPATSSRMRLMTSVEVQMTLPSPGVSES